MVVYSEYRCPITWKNWNHKSNVDGSNMGEICISVSGTSDMFLVCKLCIMRTIYTYARIINFYHALSLCRFGVQSQLWCIILSCHKLDFIILSTYIFCTLIQPLWKQVRVLFICYLVTILKCTMYMFFLFSFFFRKI